MILVSRFFMAAYLTLIVLLSFYGVHRYWILYLYYRYYKWAKPIPVPSLPETLPMVTIQLPVYNEFFRCRSVWWMRSAGWIIRKDRLEIQVLDDLTDDTEAIVRAHVRDTQAAGIS